jgi:hypothetical protein
MLVKRFYNDNMDYIGKDTLLGGFPVTTAWCIFGLQMEEQPPAMEGICEYTE